MPALDDRATAYLQAARVARLATADGEGRPHVVPVCFAVEGERAYVALDAKPKSVTPMRLKRVRNIAENPRVALLADYYSEEWSRLSYVLVSGTASLALPATREHAVAVALLRDKYPQYAHMPIEDQPVIAIALELAHMWQASEGPGVERDPRWQSFASLARERHVVRRYKPIPVPREVVEATIEAARWAPSPHGAQPWRFVVITRQDLKEKLATAMAAEWRRNLDMDGMPSEEVDERLRKSQSRITNSPVLVIPCLYMADLHVYPDPARQQAEWTMAVQSLGAAVQNMLLSAYSLGLDTGWMCAPLFVPDVVVEALDLSPDLTPHALINMGYGAQDPPRRPHRPITDLIAMYE